MNPMKEDPMKPINTLLFDLDGTLLSIDMQDFERIYFNDLSRAFSDLMPPEEFLPFLLGVTRTMVTNTELLTNESVFMAALEAKVGEAMPTYLQRFEAFYTGDFKNLAKAATRRPEIVEAVDLLKKKGYTLALATNPLFPRLAIDQRLSWTGVDATVFSYITTFEENHFCKPQLNYYGEILVELEKTPEECLMVGNDALEDLAAGKLGIRTYLLDEHLFNRHDVPIQSDWRGGYKDFLAFSKSLPTLEAQ